MREYCQIVPVKDDSEWVKEQRRNGFKFIGDDNKGYSPTGIRGWKIITGTGNIEYKCHPENMLNSKESKDPYLIRYKREDDPTHWIQEGKPYMQEDGKDLFFAEMLDAINYLASHGNWYYVDKFPLLDSINSITENYISVLMAKD